jgi:hypothetical protein
MDLFWNSQRAAGPEPAGARMRSGTAHPSPAYSHLHGKRVYFQFEFEFKLKYFICIFLKSILISFPFSPCIRSVIYKTAPCVHTKLLQSFAQPCGSSLQRQLNHHAMTSSPHAVGHACMHAEVKQQPPGTLIEVAAGLGACEKRLHVLAAVRGDGNDRELSGELACRFPEYFIHLFIILRL